MCIFVYIRMCIYMYIYVYMCIYVDLNSIKTTYRAGPSSFTCMLYIILMYVQVFLGLGNCGPITEVVPLLRWSY